MRRSRTLSPKISCVVRRSWTHTRTLCLSASLSLSVSLSHNDENKNNNNNGKYRRNLSDVSVGSFASESSDVGAFPHVCVSL